MSDANQESEKDLCHKCKVAIAQINDGDDSLGPGVCCGCYDSDYQDRDDCEYPGLPDRPMPDPIYLTQEAFLRSALFEFVAFLANDSASTDPSRTQYEAVERFIAQYPYSVVMVIENGLGKVLAVTRRNRPNDWGLPGGKINVGELPVMAAIRETEEETSVIVRSSYMCYKRVDATDGRVAWCFRATSWDGEPKSMEPGIDVAWVKPEELLADSCTFRDYNIGVLSELGLIKCPSK